MCQLADLVATKRTVCIELQRNRDFCIQHVWKICNAWAPSRAACAAALRSPHCRSSLAGAAASERSAVAAPPAAAAAGTDDGRQPVVMWRCIPAPKQRSKGVILRALSS